jgi:hypothetical protein
MFSSRKTKILDVPDDTPNQITIRSLNGRLFDNAQKENSVRAQAFIDRMGGANYRQQINEVLEQAQAKGEKNPVEEARQDPLIKYDQYYLVSRGVTAWTYPESLVPEPVVIEIESGEIVAGVTVDAFKAMDDAAKDGLEVQMRILALEDLLPERREWLAREVLRLTKPDLFLTDDEAEAAKKEISGPVPGA